MLCLAKRHSWICINRCNREWNISDSGIILDNELHFHNVLNNVMCTISRSPPPPPRKISCSYIHDLQIQHIQPTSQGWHPNAFLDEEKQLHVQWEVMSTRQHSRIKWPNWQGTTSSSRLPRPFLSRSVLGLEGSPAPSRLVVITHS